MIPNKKNPWKVLQKTTDFLLRDLYDNWTVNLSFDIKIRCYLNIYAHTLQPTWTNSSKVQKILTAFETSENYIYLFLLYKSTGISVHQNVYYLLSLTM